MNKPARIGCLIWGLTGTAVAAPATPLQNNHAPAQTAPVAMPSAGTPIGKTTAAYNYFGDRYRDPFIPLLGEVRSDQSLDRPPPVSSLTLKGIVGDANGRMALLSSGVSSYIL